MRPLVVVLGAEAIERARYRYIATLNEDAIAAPTWLDHLVAAAQSSGGNVGMFCGPILTPDGCGISSAGHWLRGSDGTFLDVDYAMAADSTGKRSGESDYEPFSPCFAAALWSIALIEDVGLPDNDQPIYYDDVELAYKARLTGWSAVFVPAAEAKHPLPQKKAINTERLAAQRRGRLAIVARYFPDQERGRILHELSHDPAGAGKDVSMFSQPFWGDDALRESVFGKWNKRNSPR